MTASSTANAMTIGQVAARTGVAVGTLRYYERARLVPTPSRTSGDHRRYSADVVDRLLFIRGSQRLGLRLAEIRELLAVRDTGVCPCGPAATVLRRHLAGVDAEIARLTALRAELATMLDGLPGPACAGPEPVTLCPAMPTGPAPEGR